MAESLEQVKADLRRNHPEMSDEDIDRLLSGRPARRRRNNNRRIENFGRRETPFEAPSTGRSTSSRRPDEADNR
jgi:hypothetical protein